VAEDGSSHTTVELAVRTEHGERRRLEIRTFANVEVPTIGQHLLVWQDFQTYLVEAIENYHPASNDDEPGEARPDLTAWLRPIT
jgi:hypothetical protein